MTGNDGLDEWRSSHLVLIGEMATGKTTIGRLLADLIGRRHLDSDELLEERLGVSGASLSGSEGVEALHEIELQVFLDVIAMADAAVISPAASVLDSETGRDALLGCVVVRLDVPVHVALRRIEEGEHRRSVDVSEIAHLRGRRLRHYRDVADLYFDTEKSEPAELAERIADALPGFR
jgi:shikimate kinase